MPIVKTPPKMTLTNLTTGERQAAQYNPATFTEEVGANYGRIAVQGLSHQVKQFGYTEDDVFNVSLEFDAITWGKGGIEAIGKARKFLLASVYPKRGAGNIATAGAPRLLFVWPGLIALTCVMTKVKFSYERFNGQAQLIGYKADLTLEEIRDTLITSEEVYDQGSERSAIGPEGT